VVITNSPLSATAALGPERKTGDSLGTKVLDKALDHQASTAAQLISSVPAPAKSEPHLGQNLNVSA